jgi:hypothetical protein
MSRPIAYNASGPLSGSIRGGSVNYTVDSGNRDYTAFASKKWVPSADGAAPIVFVTDTYTQGFELNPSLAVPLFYSCNGTGSAAILYTANRIPGSPGNYSDANVALNDLINARGYFILESNDPFEGVDADSLALDLDAAKMSSYPQVGTNWRDLSGNGNIGALTNGPTWNSNGWFDFDGIDDYGLASRTPSISPTSGITQEALVNFDADSAVIIGLQYGASSDNSYAFWRDGANWNGLVKTSSGTQVIQYNQVLTTGRWIHFLHTYSGSTQYLYVNGTQVASSGVSGGDIIYDSNNNVVVIGGDFNSGYNAGLALPLNGKLAKVGIYSKGLSQTEIKQNYFGSPIVTDGLVFAVDANNIVSYPKSGTAWYALTGSAGNATLTNGPIFSPINGGLINFDGVDDYAVTSNFPSLSNWSTEIWLNPNIYTSAQQVILDVNLGIRFETSNGFFNSHFGNGSGWIYTNLPSTTPIAANTWFHVVVTVDASVNYQAKVYVNGVLENSINISSGTTPNVPLYIARFTGAGGYEFNGKIANTRIYNRALTAAEVQQNYQAEQYRFEEPLNTPTFGLQAYWDASNLQSYPGSGTTWTDTVSGNAMTWSSPAPQWNINQFTTTPLIGSLRPMITSGYTNGRTGDGAYSVVAIFKPLSTSANQILFSIGPANNNCSGENIHPIAINSAGRFGGGACGGLGTWTTGGGVTPTTSKYYCVVTTFSGGSGGTETVYVDGVFDKSATMSTSTPVSSANRYGFGWIRDDGAAYGMNAELGVIMYYNRALTSTEVAQIYNSYKDTYQF